MIEPTIRKLGRVERKVVQVGGGATEAEGTVRTESLPGYDTLPLVVKPALAGADLAAWSAGHAAWVEEKLAAHGTLLFRGWTVGGIEPFRGVVKALGGDLEQYTYRSTPRTELGNGVYTSTEYPADKFIPHHNENSYTRSWPLRLFFYAELPATVSGGMTPIADSSRIYERIPQPMRGKFEREGVMYVRNYGEGIDLPWQEVFQTESPAEVEAFCRDHGIEYEWKDGGRLRTRQVCQAVAWHPVSKKPLWFNQAHLFHVTSLDEEVQEALMEALGEENLPRNTYYGDGTPIEPTTLDAIREAFAAEEVAFEWQREDVMLIDNMACTHARTPYKGDRKIRAAMTQAVDGSDMLIMPTLT